MEICLEVTTWEVENQKQEWQTLISGQHVFLIPLHSKVGEDRTKWSEVNVLVN
jgi:hypothetical protein